MLIRFYVLRLVMAPITVLGLCALALSFAVAIEGADARSLAAALGCALACWGAASEVRMVAALTRGAHLALGFAVAHGATVARLGREPTSVEVLRELADGIERTRGQSEAGR